MKGHMAAALFAYFLLFFGVAFLWPTWWLWRRARANALVLLHDDSAHGIIAKLLRLLVVSSFLLLAALAAGLPTHTLGRLAGLEGPATTVPGWLLLLLSLVWIALAQRQMGRSWRIGIDTRTQPPLVREGLFGRSRNPIFLGMRLNFAGLFLVLPNATTLAFALLAEALIQVQVRLEEAHLSTAFGETYAEYRRAVPRWI